jgi:hypothetical protein
VLLAGSLPIVFWMARAVIGHSGLMPVAYYPGNGGY